MNVRSPSTVLVFPQQLVPQTLTQRVKLIWSQSFGQRITRDKIAQEADLFKGMVVHAFTNKYDFGMFAVFGNKSFFEFLSRATTYFDA